MHPAMNFSTHQRRPSGRLWQLPGHSRAHYGGPGDPGIHPTALHDKLVSALPQPTMLDPGMFAAVAGYGGDAIPRQPLYPVAPIHDLQAFGWHQPYSLPPFPTRHDLSEPPPHWSAIHPPPYGAYTEYDVPSSPPMLNGTIDSTYGKKPTTASRQPQQSLRPPQEASSLASPPLTRRGPPRKPKRSGHACWVGNIAPDNPISSLHKLKDLFSTNLAEEIESVFLMERSSCAFVNYRSERACNKAVSSFNHWMFFGARLLCRLKRDLSGEDCSPLSPLPSCNRRDSRTMSVQLHDIVHQLSEGGEEMRASDSEDQENIPPQQPKNRYFILKSLTQEDLKDSYRKGVWVTQPHVQQILHEAWQASDNVYLVFSVNKSGEYFGYARMSSSPFDDNAAAVPHHHHHQHHHHHPHRPHHPSSPSSSSSSSEHPDGGIQIYETPATRTAPRGRIVNDPARNTLFWEVAVVVGAVAEREEKGEDEGGSGSTLRNYDSQFAAATTTDDAPTPRPFHIEWKQVRAVAFQRVRGIRNPWNGSKDVKVARDGTELETGIGHRILAMFHEDE